MRRERRDRNDWLAYSTGRRRFRIRFSMLGGCFSRFWGAFLDFPGFDYEFQTLGATEPPRFSEQYESSDFLRILITPIIPITLSILIILITRKDISLCQRARVFRKTMQRYNIFSALCDLERLRAT